VNAVLLIPLSANYRPKERVGDVGAFAIHWIPMPDLEVFRVPITAYSLRDPGVTGGVLTQSAAFVTLALIHVRHALEARYDPRERRRLARAGKRCRRGALAIPMAQRWETQVYRPDGTPDDVLRVVGKRFATPVRTVWRCPWWRRGAPIWHQAAFDRQRGGSRG